MTGSELTVKALGLKTDGIEAKESLGCVLCGRRIKPGERYSRWIPGPNFTDGPSLTHRQDARFQCEYCAAVLPAAVFAKLQRHVITMEGVYPISKSEHRRWFLESPPEPPFLSVLSDSKRAHMIWRTPVSRSKDAIFIRVSGRLFCVNRPRVLAASKISSTLAERTGYKYCSHPFASTEVTRNKDTDNTMEFGRIRPHVGAVLTSEERNLFLSLSPGDVWALGVLASSRTEAVMPPVISDLKKISEPVGD